MKLCNINAGLDQPLFLIAGPCVIESEDMTIDVDVEDTEDVNVDIEKEVDVEDEEVESDIEVKTSVPGESADEDAVLGLLTKAQEEAEGMGDEKLLDQIGNTMLA